VAKRRNDDAEQLLFVGRAEWRRWLQKNHDKVRAIWMVYLKGEGAAGCINYEDAVEEALCWGWIDSIIKKIDEKRYVRKFTPRQAGSRWSALNKTRIERVIAAGLMRRAGLAKIVAARKNGEWEVTNVPAGGLEGLPEFCKALSVDKKAGEFFEKLAPSYKKQFLGWIGEAKRDETRARRVAEAIKLLRQGKRLGMQ
jgi:uncharacterized protein YdeI (YjbR/CyaY-like superfamily)